VAEEHRAGCWALKFDRLWVIPRNFTFHALPKHLLWEVRDTSLRFRILKKYALYPLCRLCSYVWISGHKWYSIYQSIDTTGSKSSLVSKMVMHPQSSKDSRWLGIQVLRLLYKSIWPWVSIDIADRLSSERNAIGNEFPRICILISSHSFVW
jgi:hypothetical protein